ncbi:MAG: 30S ribosomal protein S21 [Bacteroidia bacterium]|nr:30S ribosomal protein S21 [Bacteroidia bacterium]
MLIVQIKEGDTLEKALKKFKKKFEKTGILRELRNRQFYTKPSVRKKEILKRAIFRQKLEQGLIEK